MNTLTTGEIARRAGLGVEAVRYLSHAKCLGLNRRKNGSLGSRRVARDASLSPGKFRPQRRERLYRVLA